MDRLKYLLGLKPTDRLNAALIIAVIFLSSGWTITEFNFSSYRTKSENDKEIMQRNHSIEIIVLYNRIIDGQTKRQEQLDSAINEVKNILETKIQKP